MGAAVKGVGLPCRCCPHRVRSGGDANCALAIVFFCSIFVVFSSMWGLVWSYCVVNKDHDILGCGLVVCGLLAPWSSSFCSFFARGTRRLGIHGPITSHSRRPLCGGLMYEQLEWLAIPPCLANTVALVEGARKEENGDARGCRFGRHFVAFTCDKQPALSVTLICIVCAEVVVVCYVAGSRKNR